jgi:transcriptional regulator
MVVFTGPHGYISPSWYETDLAVPTWNYVAVHVYGTATVLEDDSAVAGLLERLVAKYESTMPNPWRLQAPEEWQANLRKAIVGFEITVSRVEGKAKLSQNRPAVDIAGAIAGLVGQGNAELAAMMWGVNGPKLEAANIGGQA